MQEKNVRDLLYGVNRLKAYDENDEFIGYVTNLDGVTCGIYFKQNDKQESTLFNFRKSLVRDNNTHVWLSIDYYGSNMKVKVTNELYSSKEDGKVKKKCGESLKDKLRRGENKAVFIKKTNEKVGYAAYFPYTESYFGVYRPKGNNHERFASFYEGSEHFIEKDGVIEFTAILDSKAEELVVKDIDYVDINEEIKKKEKLKMEWSNPNEKQDKKFIKFDDGKRRYELLPPRELAQVVDILMLGANKYGKDNWKKMDDEGADRIVGAVYRHFEAWRQGDKIDKESGENHLAHAITNLLFLLWRDNEERG